MSGHWRVFLLPLLMGFVTCVSSKTAEQIRDEYLKLITCGSELDANCSEPSADWYSPLVNLAGVPASQLVDKIRNFNPTFQELSEEQAIAKLDSWLQPLIEESRGKSFCIPIKKIVCLGNSCTEYDNIDFDEIKEEPRKKSLSDATEAVQIIARNESSGGQPLPTCPAEPLTEPDKKQLTQGNNLVDELRQTARKSGKNLGDACEDLSKDAPSSEVVSKYSGRNGGEQQVKDLMRDQPGSQKMSKDQAMASAQALFAKLSGWLKNYQENGCDVKKALVCKDGKCAKCEEAGPTLAAACKEFQKLIDPEGAAKGSSASWKAVGVVVFGLLSLAYSFFY